MRYIKRNSDIVVFPDDLFSLSQTLDCGQAFRWEEKNGKWHGIAKGVPLTVYQQGEEVIFTDTSEETFLGLWKNYFDFDTDYKKIRESFERDPHLKKAMEFCGGIRLLNQEPWEALCSFIISQNNNIPRIKGIIERLCSSFGENLGNGDFSFPGAEKLASLSPEDLAPLRAGFRAKYIIDGARKIASGEVDASFGEKSTEEALQELMKIKGVGPKVASCALLFGCSKKDAFPIDVWVKKILSELYPEGFPFENSPYKGAAQQYLFHYRRFSENFPENREKADKNAV